MCIKRCMFISHVLVLYQFCCLIRPCLCISVLVMYSYVAQHQLSHWKIISGIHLRSDLRSFRSLTEVKVSGGQLTLGQCLGATRQASLTWGWPLQPGCCHGVSQSAYHWGYYVIIDDSFLRRRLSGNKLWVNSTLVKIPVTMVTCLTGRMGCWEHNEASEWRAWKLTTALLCHSWKCTGANTKMNTSCIAFRCPSCKALILCMQAQYDLRHKNGSYLKVIGHICAFPATTSKKVYRLHW